MKIDELHDNLFEMWLMFDEICKKNNIRYFFDSGSLLGAVREHDYIPWDDDMDMVIMRSDYKKLRSILKKELKAPYKFIEPVDFMPYFYDFVPRIINTSVDLRSETDEDRAYHCYQNKLSIDFFIMDSVPDSKIIQEITILKCKVIYGIARSKRYALHEESLSIKERISSRICLIIGKLFSLERIIPLYEKILTRYSSVESRWIIKGNNALYFIKCYQKDWYKEIIYTSFHEHEVPIPTGFHNVLTKMFGDYMTPSRNYKGYISHADVNK